MSLFTSFFDSVFLRHENPNSLKGLPAAGDLSFPGVGPLTPIVTDFGPVPAQALRLRDRVRLRSGQYSAISSIDRLLLDEAFLERHPGAQPVLIEPKMLGDVVPTEPILLAPGQKLSRQQDMPQICRTAYDLCRSGVARRHSEQFMTYVLFSFPEPEDVCSSGLWLHVEPAPQINE